MKIYIAHSREFDYINKLYKPLKENSFFSNYNLIFPYEKEMTDIIQNIIVDYQGKGKFYGKDY